MHQSYARRSMRVLSGGEWESLLNESAVDQAFWRMPRRRRVPRHFQKLCYNYPKFTIDKTITMCIIPATSLAGALSRDSPVTERGAVPTGCFVTSPRSSTVPFGGAE